MIVNNLKDLCALLTKQEMYIGTYKDKRGTIRPQISIKVNGKLVFLNKNYKTKEVVCNTSKQSILNEKVTA